MTKTLRWPMNMRRRLASLHLACLSCAKRLPRLPMLLGNMLQLFVNTELFDACQAAMS